MRPRSDLVLRIASTSEVAKTHAATYTGTIAALDRLSPTTVALTLETPDRDGSGVPARSVRQRRGPRHRRDPVVLVQPARPTTRALLPRQAHPRRRDVAVPGRPGAASATRSPSPVPTAASSSARPSGRCCSRGRHRARADPVDAAPMRDSGSGRRSPPDLRRQHRRGPRRARRDRRSSPPSCPASPGTTACPTRPALPPTRGT